MSGMTASMAVLNRVEGNAAAPSCMWTAPMTTVALRPWVCEHWEQVRIELDRQLWSRGLRFVRYAHLPRARDTSAHAEVGVMPSWPVGWWSAGVACLSARDDPGRCSDRLEECEQGVGCVVAAAGPGGGNRLPRFPVVDRDFRQAIGTPPAGRPGDQRRRWARDTKLVPAPTAGSVPTAPDVRRPAPLAVAVPCPTGGSCSVRGRTARGRRLRSWCSESRGRSG